MRKKLMNKMMTIENSYTYVENWWRGQAEILA